MKTVIPFSELKTKLMNISKQTFFSYFLNVLKHDVETNCIRHFFFSRISEVSFSGLPQVLIVFENGDK